MHRVSVVDYVSPPQRSHFPVICFTLVMWPVQSVDTASVHQFVRNLLSGRASGVFIGDQAIMPKFSTVARRFGS
jgi:hypothetical protein